MAVALRFGAPFGLRAMEHGRHLELVPYVVVRDVATHAARTVAQKERPNGHVIVDSDLRYDR